MQEAIATASWAFESFIVIVEDRREDRMRSKAYPMADTEIKMAAAVGKSWASRRETLSGK